MIRAVCFSRLRRRYSCQKPLARRGQRLYTYPGVVLKKKGTGVITLIEIVMRLAGVAPDEKLLSDS